MDTSNRYDFDMFGDNTVRKKKPDVAPRMSEHRNRYNSSAAPKREPTVNPTIRPYRRPVETPVRPVEPTTRERKNKKSRLEVITQIFNDIVAFVKVNRRTIFRVAVCSFLVALIVVSPALMVRYDGELAKVKQETRSVASELEIEKVRARDIEMELAALTTTQKIESYAENVLGMVKQSESNSIPVKLEATDGVTVSGGKSYTDTGESSARLMAYLKGMFGIEDTQAAG